ncbi:hypothetical protein FBY03_11125 [Pseudomonas sp. SJZ079]|nr:hypothetical protein FBY03_11125 [Pseudomonas sp. SJZ079]
MLLCFQLVFLLMFVLAWVRPFVYSHFFLILFLFLGFCLKFNAHLFFDYPFVEPVGDFSGSPQEWDRALAGGAAAALGVVVFKFLQLIWYYFYPSVRSAAGQLVPNWYLRFPGFMWVSLILFSVVLYVTNYFFAFYQTGVNSRLVLPFGLGAVFAWLCYCGSIIVFYLMLDWEYFRRKDRTWPLVWSLCLLGVLVSVSLLSRATVVLLFLSFSMVLIFHKKDLLLQLWGSWRWRILVLPVLSLFISLVLVSWFRMNTYHYESSAVSAMPVPERSTASQIEPSPLEGTGMTPTLMFVEVMRLGVDRWIGLEGMLVFAASDARGLPVFKSILSESPGTGINSIFQQLSNSPYKLMKDFTYLTLPGASALLFSSGSLMITFGGMLLLAMFLSLFECFTFWASQSRFVTSWMGVLMANAVCQMSFPYLWGVFVVESFLALCTLAFIIRRPQGEH